MVNSWPLRVRAFLSSAEPRAALSRRAFVADGLLALAAVVAALAALNSGTSAARVAAVVSTTPLAARRSAPLAAFWVMLTGLLLAGDVDVHQRTALETIMDGSHITIAVGGMPRGRTAAARETGPGPTILRRH